MPNQVPRTASKAMVALFSAFMAVLLASQSVFAAVAWTAPVNAGTVYSWNYGQGLARTTTSTTSHLHTQYMTAYIGGQFVTDGGPKAGVYYRRGSASGSSWGTPKRINGKNEHGVNGAIAATGKYVAVAYTTVAHIGQAYVPSDPRTLKVRINTNHGAGGSWLAATPLSDSALRVDRPSIAASSNQFAVTWTNADTGEIMLARTGGVIGGDWGYAVGAVGATTRLADDEDNGYEGLPVVASAGSKLLVAWIDSDAGTIKAIVSTNGGQTWSTPTTITGTQVWDLSATAKGGRLALGWGSAGSIKLKLWKDGTWRAARTVASFSASGTYKVGYAPAIGLAGKNRVGVAWSACTRADCSAGSAKGVDVRWRESTDNGRTWKKAATIASHAASKKRRINDYPSVVMTAKRFVLYNTSNAGITAFRVKVEVGSGTP